MVVPASASSEWPFRAELRSSAGCVLAASMHVRPTGAPALDTGPSAGSWTSNSDPSL